MPARVEGYITVDASDYNSTFSQMVENRREADQAKAENKVLTGGPSVSEIRSSC